MQWYLEKIGPHVRSVLQPGEVTVAATPAEVPAGPADSGAPSPAPRTPRRGAVALRQRAEPARPPFAGRMILLVTDRRLLVFGRRRWRMLPRGVIGHVPLETLGNVEGRRGATGGIADLELVFILHDGSASSVRVPSGCLELGREFVRRAQVRLLG